MQAIAVGVVVAGILAAMHPAALSGQTPPGASPPTGDAPPSIAAGCPAAILSPPSTGLALVLSGGGARGIAHIGVLRVLDSLGVRPDIVVGTSMGALVGALYAGGLSGIQIDSLARDVPFESLFRRYEPLALMTVGDFTAPLIVLPPTFVLEFRGDRLRLQSPVAREPKLNALFNQLLLSANLAAAGDFDRLPRRFRAIATDTRTRSALVLRSGDLAEAVRASIAIPVVFAPVERDGHLLIDGGLSDNIPVGVARQIGANAVLVSDVSAAETDSTNDVTTASIVAYLIDELFMQPPDSLSPRDLLLRPPVSDFSPLEFTGPVVDGLIAAGYREAAEMLRGCPVNGSAPPVVPPPRIAQAGGISRSLARFADEGIYESVWLRPRLVTPLPQLGDTTGTTPSPALEFSPVAVLSPQRTLSVGVSYNGHDGARAWLAAANVTSTETRIRVGSALSLSQWRQQILFTGTLLRRHPLPRDTTDTGIRLDQEIRLPDPRSDTPPWSTLARDLLRPELSLTASREIIRFYDDRGREVEKPSAQDLVIFGGVGATLAAGRRVVIGPVAHFWSSRSSSMGDDDAQAYGGMLRIVRTFAAPADAPDPNLVPAVSAEALWLDRYHRADIRADLAVSFREFLFRPRAAAGWGEDLPLGAHFIMGGSEGFPGLRTGERRGDRFAFGSLAILHRLGGPFFARVEAGVARTSFASERQTGAAPAAAGGYVRGLEVGVTTDTPLGPFMIGYGISSTERPVFKIQLGR